MPPGRSRGRWDPNQGGGAHLKHEMELFRAFTIDEVQDRRELFGYIDPSDISSSASDLSYWIFYWLD